MTTFTLLFRFKNTSTLHTLHCAKIPSWYRRKIIPNADYHEVKIHTTGYLGKPTSKAPSFPKELPKEEIFSAPTVKKIREPIPYKLKKTRCFCPYTGIYCLFESPNGLAFEYTHPLATYKNVENLLAYSHKAGLPLARLELQILAGVLVSILRHKGILAHCKNAGIVNSILCRIPKNQLQGFVNFFFSLPSSVRLPKLHINENLLDSENWKPEFLLTNYIRIIRGEDKDVTEQRNLEDLPIQKITRIRGKILTGSEKEVSTIKASKKQALTLLDSLYPTDSELKSSLRRMIEGIGFLSPENKLKIATRLKKDHPESIEAKTLAGLFLVSSSDEIEKELLTVSQEITPASSLSLKEKLALKLANKG